MQMKTAVYLLATLLALTCTLREVRGDPEANRGQKMAEALKMLQSLDKYYGQIARPRSPRSPHYGVHLLSRKDEASLKMRLRDLDSEYLHRSRPRYGKRGDFPRLQDRFSDVMNEEMADEAMWEPIR